MKAYTSAANSYIEPKFSRSLTGLRKNDNTEYALLTMIENWKTQLNNKSKVGVVIMDLSEAFDTLNHKLLIAKLEAFDLDSGSSSFLQSYLTNRYQRTRIRNAFSDWESIIAKVPQGSILEPLIFNVFMNNFFF